MNVGRRPRARRLRSAAGSINSGRHILESRCANDVFSTSFRATLREPCHHKNTPLKTNIDFPRSYYPGQKNRYSRDIHEIDLQYDHAISRDIDFDLRRELATRSYRESRRCRTEARYRTISHDRPVDQPHEFLGCNDFFGQGSISMYKEASVSMKVFSFDLIS